MMSPIRWRFVAPVSAAALLAAATLIAPHFAGAGPQPASSFSPDGIWQSVDQIPATPAGKSVEIKVKEFKAFTVDRGHMSTSLSGAAMEAISARAAGGAQTMQSGAAPAPGATEITLPTPDGTYARFRIEEVALMEPQLAAQFPDIKTYRGHGIDDPLARLHLDVNARTIHAQVLSPSGTWYIDPYWHHDGSLYMSYRKSDLLTGDRRFECLVDHPDHAHHVKGDATQTTQASTAAVAPENATTGRNLRTYRLACATSLRYSQYHGGANPDIAKVIAALATMNNRVSGIYETELGIRMVLVNSTAAIVATTTNPTPYSDTPGDIGTNPAYLDQKVGPDNYDIGHIVTTGSGGIAGLGVVCRGFNVVSGGSAKARGTTGIDPPVGDGFWVDYVAHEMGHQFGGNHTFDGTGTNCGTNQNASTAYEPGSGTTIQAYAGICGNQNIQPNSDPYFHFASLLEMYGYAAGGAAAQAVAEVHRASSASGGNSDEPNANPSSGTLSPTGPDLIWNGTALGGASADESTCVEGVTCDTFTLTLSGEPGDWQNKNARITFTWPSPVDDYDVFVRKGGPNGPLVDDSASSSQPEVINIDPAARDVGTGVFTVRVVYFSVVPPAQQYRAVATVVDLSNPGVAPTCAVLTPTGNNPPTADAGPDFTIPARTAFALTGKGTDPDGNPITYAWEQADLGPTVKDANAPDDGKNPIFRSFLPKLNPTRTFPRWTELLANQTQTRSEKLPTTTRELNFRLTTRDNIFGGWGMDAVKLNVIDAGTGFAVTSPNGGETLPGGGTHTVTWNVANTTGPEINTTRVNILLATDAAVGANGEDPAFPIMLAANVPNDGSEVVTLPRVATTKARIMVQAVDNVYFDISDADFTIAGADLSPVPAQLLNISTRMRVQTGDNVMIGGFIITGSAPKKVVLRAMGPSLSNGGAPLGGRLEDPTLELVDSGGSRIAFNDNWKDTDQRQEVENANLQPADDRESAIARTLAPGLYTAIVRGNGNSSGVGLVEVYDADRLAFSQLANISTRGFVETGDNVMIGGFIVGDQTSGIQVVVRAIGPSLKPLLPQALDDPTLQLVDQHGSTISSNDNWRDSPERADIERVGLAPSQDSESALFAGLAPAPYTAIVRGRDQSTGVALVEVYRVQLP